MADQQLRFDLVSPERQLRSEAVEMVVVPGTIFRMFSSVRRCSTLRTTPLAPMRTA